MWKQKNTVAPFLCCLETIAQRSMDWRHFPIKQTAFRFEFIQPSSTNPMIFPWFAHLLSIFSPVSHFPYNFPYHFPYHFPIDSPPRGTSAGLPRAWRLPRSAPRPGAAAPRLRSPVAARPPGGARQQRRSGERLRCEACEAGRMSRPEMGCFQGQIMGKWWANHG